MARDTITLALGGEVLLEAFASTVAGWRALLLALTSEQDGQGKVDWVLQDLQAGSMMATVAAVSDDQQAVQRIVRAYTQVARAIAGGPRSADLSPRVAQGRPGRPRHPVGAE